MDRRGFLKSLALAPVAALTPSLLWLPEQKILVPELQPALVPLLDATQGEDRIYGYFTTEAVWRDPTMREIILRDAAYAFPRGAQMIVIPTDGAVHLPGVDPRARGGSFGRFIYKGAGREHALQGVNAPIAQAWLNGDDVERQLWFG